MLKVMLSVVPSVQGYEFVIAKAPSLDREVYDPYLLDHSIRLVDQQTYALLSCAHAALVTSGTATLETALFKVPQVVCYKGNWISYQIAKRIITLDYISLVNLIMDRLVVKELIQNDLNTANLVQELSLILEGKTREKMIQAYGELAKKLGGPGASDKVARLLLERN